MSGDGRNSGFRCGLSSWVNCFCGLMGEITLVMICHDIVWGLSFSPLNRSCRLSFGPGFSSQRCSFPCSDGTVDGLTSRAVKSAEASELCG